MVLLELLDTDLRIKIWRGKLEVDIVHNLTNESRNIVEPWKDYKAD